MKPDLVPRQFLSKLHLAEFIMHQACDKLHPSHSEKVFSCSGKEIQCSPAVLLED